MPQKTIQKTKINDFIFKELIKRGHSLEGNTRVWNIADSKLWYLTPEQAQAYLDLEDSEDYVRAVNQKQGEGLILNNVPYILEKIKEKAFNVIDLGCGDGKKAAAMIDRIKKLNKKIKIRYCPIDISGYMVSKAIETFSKLGIDAEIVEFKYNISDFENLENIVPLLMKNGIKRDLFLLLGNTLGNFEVNELLYEIRSAMKDDDVLVIDTAIADKNIEKKAEMQAKNKRVDKFLRYIPLQIGLDEDDVEYSARFRNSRIEFYYTIKKDRAVEFQDKRVLFNKGDQIIVAIAYKHDKSDLMTFLNMYFSEVDVAFSSDKVQALTICRK